MLANGILTASILAFAQVVAGADPQTGWKPDYCRNYTAPAKSTTVPRKYGFMLFRAFDMLDVFGTLEVLYQVSWQYKIELYLIAETLEPVTVAPLMPSMNKMNSSWFPEVLPTHTYETAPRDLDVILVPGGIGSRSPYLNKTVDFLAEIGPKVDYFISVCTGAILASNAGMLDGKRATTNKNAWSSVTSANNEVDWIGHARWVVDGSLWTTSGVSAGIDGVLAFVECIYGPEVATTVAHGMEYIRHTDPSDDPFADLHNITAKA